jgi:NAD+ synthase
MMCVHYLANTHGFLVAGTGNRSELEIGYFTKYGDGGSDFLPIGDLYKDEVFELAAELGIPDEIINRPPSAGLWPRQTDEGEMGMTYRDLNQALRALDAGQTDRIDPAVLERVMDMNRRSEHKRHMPPICRIQR